MDFLRQWLSTKTQPAPTRKVRVEVKQPRNPEEPSYSHFLTEQKNMTEEQLKNYDLLTISHPMPYENVENRFRNRRAKITSNVYFPKKRAAILKAHLNKIHAENEAYAPIAKKQYEEEQTRLNKMKKEANQIQAIYFTEVLGRGGKRTTRRVNRKTRKHKNKKQK